MSYFTGKSILIISTENWDHVAVSKHHYAKSLVKDGAKVYFLNPPSNTDATIYIENNLTIVDYKTIKGINLLPRLFRYFVNKLLVDKIARLCKSTFDVVWTFDPYRFQNLHLFGTALKIYHPVDFHEFKLEWEVVKTCDFILSVSDLILRRYPSAKAFKINHGLAEHFLNSQVAIVNGPAKTVGYVGNLESKSLDVPILKKIVDLNRGVKFVFIGPYIKNSLLSSYLMTKSNCQLLGQLKSEEMPIHFSSFDLFLICYHGERRINNSNSHKVLEFLSTGKPVVMNYTDEYTSRKELVVMTEDNDALPDLLKNVIFNYSKFMEPPIVKRRMQFAQSNSYTSHIERIAQIAEQMTRKNL